jgi:hypothetical protein
VCGEGSGEGDAAWKVNEGKNNEEKSWKRRNKAHILRLKILKCDS